MAGAGDVVQRQGHLPLARGGQGSRGLRRGDGHGHSRGSGGHGGFRRGPGGGGLGRGGRARGRRAAGQGGGDGRGDRDRGDTREADLLSGRGSGGAGGGQRQVRLRGGGGSGGRRSGRFPKPGEGPQSGGGARAGGLVKTKLSRCEPGPEERPQGRPSLPVECGDDRGQERVLDGARRAQLGDDPADVGELGEQTVADRFRGGGAVAEEPGDVSGEQGAEVERGAVASCASQAAEALGEAGEGAEALGEASCCFVVCLLSFFFDGERFFGFFSSSSLKKKKKLLPLTEDAAGEAGEDAQARAEQADNSA